MTTGLQEQGACGAGARKGKGREKRKTNSVKRFGTILWKGIKELAGQGAGAGKQEKRRMEAIKQVGKLRDGYMQAEDQLVCVFLNLQTLQNTDDGIGLQEGTSVLRGSDKVDCEIGCCDPVLCF